MKEGTDGTNWCHTAKHSKPVDSTSSELRIGLFLVTFSKASESYSFVSSPIVALIRDSDKQLSMVSHQTHPTSELVPPADSCPFSVEAFCSKQQCVVSVLLPAGRPVVGGSGV